MRNELHKFIKEIADGDRSKYSNFRMGEDRLMHEFAEFLGFRRWHSPILRPDNDPKWLPFRWSVDNGSCYITDVRVMSFPFLTANSFEPDVCFPNGMNAHDLVVTLKRMRSAYKQGEGELYNEYQIIAKFLLNSLYSVICRHGSAIGMGAHHINEKVRGVITDAVKKISETGIVVYVYSDFIVYIGDQVEIPGVHHEKFKYAVLSQYGNNYGISYSDTMQSHCLPNMKFRIGEWNDLIGSGTYEQRLEQAQKRYQRKIAGIKNDLFRYIAITKEDVDLEIQNY